MTTPHCIVEISIKFELALRLRPESFILRLRYKTVNSNKGTEASSDSTLQQWWTTGIQLIYLLAATITSFVNTNTWSHFIIRQFTSHNYIL